jgi:Tol biopolymer transport system component
VDHYNKRAVLRTVPGTGHRFTRRLTMKGQTATLLGLGLVTFLLGCRPDASEKQSDLSLAGAALETHPQLARQNPQDRLVIRRLWEGPRPVYHRMSVSPDGRFVSEMDWDSGDLALIDLQSGERKPVTHKAEYFEFAETSVFSPDGRQLAYTYWNEAWNEPSGSLEIRSIGIDGSGQRTIVPNSGPGFYARLKDWSDDGLHILALLGDESLRDLKPEATVRVALISVADGSIRTVKEYHGGGPGSRSVCVLSPDERFVAYDLSSSPRADHDIYLLPVDGGREVALLSGPTDDRLLGWLPDGSGVLFYSDRGRTNGIWTLRVSNGRPESEPTLLRGDVWGLQPIGFSRDAYYYGVTTQQPQVYTAIIDPQAWRPVAPPVAIEDPGLGQSSGPVAWSPDGRYLAYLRNVGERDPKLVVRSFNGEDSREISVTRIEPMGLLRWTADGQAVLMPARDSSAVGVFKLDVGTGTVTKIWQVVEGVWPHPLAIQFSSDLKTAYFARMVGERLSPTAPNVIVAHDLASGREREIATVRSIQGGSLSPDGRTLAFADGESARDMTRIATVPTSGGEIREVIREARPEDLGMPSTVSWSSDGRYILFADHGDQPNRYSLWRVPAAGGEPSRMECPWGERPLGLFALKFQPEGNRIAFADRGWRGEIWVVENLPGTR